MATHHTLAPTPATVHWGYLDAKIPPRLTIESGDTVTIDTVSGGLADVGDTSIMLPHHREICEKLKPSPGPHILTGPIAVRGAEPGDTLEVRIKAMRAHRRLGLEPDPPAARHAARGLSRVPLPHHSDRPPRHDREPAVGRDHSAQPVLRHPGRGAAAEYGPCSSVEPREFGGNIDNKEFVAGTSLYLPVFVPGANFSCGDGHAVQGDGEVCLTALETCLTGHVRARRCTSARLAMPRAITPTHYITMGLDPDLDDAAKQALRDMIRWLVDLKGWSSEEAYVFCSLACDLRVTQLVDGNKGIHAMVERGLVE